MNLQQQEEFYQVMTRLKTNSRSASTQVAKDDARVTEMINGLLVSNPTKEPVVIDLQEYAKSAAASVPSINKLKVIQDFIRSNGRI
jgi:hypothetical protein